MASNFEDDKFRCREFTLSFKCPSAPMSAATACADKEFSNVSTVARAALAEVMRRKGFLDDK